jgi:threonine dehydrogenase-like Zn-dependent dehydrogenase
MEVRRSQKKSQGQTTRTHVGILTPGKSVYHPRPRVEILTDDIQAVFMTAPKRPLERRRVPAPRPRPGGAVLETIASEVCGTDVHLWHGRLSGVPYPILPGHVSVGRVLETGGTLVDVEGRAIAQGALVTFYDVYGACGACWHCLVARAATRCPHRRVYGITAPANEGLLGGWSEQIEILPGVRLVPLPENLSAEDFLGGGCGMPTGFHAVERAGVAMGDTVVVQGSGPVGLNAAIFAQLSGALRVFVVGAPKARLDAARRLGAEDTLDISEITNPADRAAWVRERTSGRGADVVIEASGNPAAVPEGLEMLRDAGRYVVVGQYTDAGDATLNPHRQINRRHATILGCWGYEFSHLHRALAMMAKHDARFRWRDLVTREYPLAKAQEALEEMERLRVVKALIRPRQ